MKVFRGKMESACLSIHVSVCVQNTSVWQSLGGGIKSHLVTALVSFSFFLLSFHCLWPFQRKINIILATFDFIMCRGLWSGEKFVLYIL